MECLSNDTICQFLNRSLPARVVEQVQEHLDQCPPCFQLLYDVVQCDASPVGVPDGLSATLPSPGSAAGSAGAGPGAPKGRGTVLGRYTVLDRVGIGGMAEVYAAYDPHLRRRLALKVLRPSRAGDTGALSRLLREAQALARLSHPNVIKVYDVGWEGAQIFIAMKLVDGCTLRGWLQAPRTQAEVLGVFRQAGQGLAAAHQAGLVHRDFKPDNVLCCKDGRVLVTDFGLAHVLDEQDPPLCRAGEEPGPLQGDPVLRTRTQALLGTPAYMAPEQYLGQAVSPWTDQFAFCVALYEALYGERPFAAGSVADMGRRIVEGRVREAPRDRAVPALLRGVLLRGLAVAPADRHPSMAALCEALA